MPLRDWVTSAVLLLAVGSKLLWPHMRNCYHSVDEGHLGLYYRGGELQPYTAAPGAHFMAPFLYTFEQVKIGLRTETVHRVPCGTSGGVVLHFDHVEVVVRVDPTQLWETAKNYSASQFIDIWIRKPLHHEVNQLCSGLTLHDVFIGRFSEIDDFLRQALAETHAQWAPGLQVVSVRLSKPTIPEAIRENFEAVAAKATELKTVTERQAVTLATAEKDKSLAVMEATKQLGVARQTAAAEVSQALQQVAITNVTTETEAARVEEHADARHYAKLKEAEANGHTLTETFLALQRQKHLLKNTVLYWGDAIPDSIVVSEDEQEEGGGYSGGRRSGGGGERDDEETAAFLAARQSWATSSAS